MLGNRMLMHNDILFARLLTVENPNLNMTPDGDYFGTTIVSTETHVAIAATGESNLDGSILNVGVVYLYEFVGNGINLVLAIENPTQVAGYFGMYMDMDGDYLVISAYSDDTHELNGGIVYLHNLSDGSLAQTIINPSGTIQFGRSLAMKNETYLAVTELDSNIGSVLIYDYGTWIHSDTIEDPNMYGTTAEDIFGADTKININNLMVASAYYEDDVNNNQTGAIYLIDLTTGDVIYETANPDRTPGDDNDYFGQSVAIGELYYAGHAPYEDLSEGDTTHNGIVYIFSIATGDLVRSLLIVDNIYEAGYSFGAHMEIIGDLILIGASNTKDLDTGETTSGAVFIYKISTGELLKIIKNPNFYSTRVGDYFGFSFSVTADMIIISSRSENYDGGENSGVVYFFKNDLAELLIE